MPVRMESCHFIPLPSLGLSRQGMKDIIRSQDLTFGYANVTLYTVERLLDRVEFTDNADYNKLAQLEQNLYLDLES